MAAPEGSEDAFDEIDFEKIRQVLISGWPWMLGIVTIFLVLAFLYMRYNKPLYNAESILKLDIKNEASLLGIPGSGDTGIKGISGEIEIIKSRLFLKKVVNAIGLDVSYYHPGRSHLVDERYDNSPFEVIFEFKNGTYYDQPFTVEIINDELFSLTSSNGSLIVENHPFGEKFETNNYWFVLSKTSFFDDQMDLTDFFFVINSERSLINYLVSNLNVEPVNLNANTIRISLSDHNQQKAKALLTAIDTLYLKYTERVKNRATEQKISFLNGQMGRTSTELEAFEDYFEKFTIEHRTTDLSKDLNRTIMLLNALDSQRYVLNEKIADIRLLENQYELNQPMTISMLPEGLGNLLSGYVKLVNERDLLLESYNENTQVIKTLDKKIELAQRSGRKRIDRYKLNLNESLEDVETKRVFLEKNFIELPSMGTSYNKNHRLYSLQEEFYFSMIKTKMNLEITKAGTVTNFVVLSPAAVSDIPIHPKPLIVYGIAGVAGLFISFLTLALTYLLHDKITTQKELEKLIHAPILGLVPKYKAEKLVNTKLIVTNNPKSSISEALRSIRTNMEFIASGGDNQLISVTSTVSGEGKTFITVNLGAICAYAGQKVVVVDLDMRKPKVHLAFESTASQRGVSTLLIGKEKLDDCILPSELENLSFIPAGPTPPNPSELLLSQKFDEFLEELKTRFDVIFLDSPPVGLVTDGILIMKKADLPIYVVRAEYSKKSYLKSVHRLISNNKFEHLSVILNAVSSGKGSGYGYGYGYGYDDSYYE